MTTDTFPPFAKARAWILRLFPYAGYVSAKAFPRKYRSMQTTGGSYVAQSNTWIGSLLHCPYCIGFWISVAVTVAWVVAPAVALWGCFVMGLRWLTGAVLNSFD